MKKRVLINFMEMMLEKGKMSKVLGEKYTLINLLRAEIGNYCDNNNLRGYSYSNSKDYFMNVCLPALRQFEECCKVFEECADTIKIKYVECFGLVHSLPTDTDELEAMLSELEIELKSLKAERDSFQFDIYTGTHSSSSSVHMASYESICSNIIAVENRIRKIKEFIDKMYEFDNSAQLIFNRFFEEYDKVKMIADRLRADRGGRSIFGCCERSHWTVSDSLKQCIVDMQMELLLKSNGHIDWAEAKRMMNAGDDVSAMVLPFLLDRYDLPADTSYSDFLLYLSVYDPEVINNYFSKIYSEGEINYEYIEKLMWSDSEDVSDKDYAMLIAAFSAMDDDERSDFIALSYSATISPIGVYENTQRYIYASYSINCQLSPIFVEMTEKYGNEVKVNENYSILLQGNDVTEYDNPIYAKAKDLFQNYNILCGACLNTNICCSVKNVDPENAALSQSEMDSIHVEIDISQFKSDYNDPLDKKIVYYASYDDDLGVELGDSWVISEQVALAYRKRPINILKEYVGELNGSTDDKLSQKMLEFIWSDTLGAAPITGVSECFTLMDHTKEVVEILYEQDAMSIVNNATKYMNYMDFYGIEGQTIINANNNSVIYTAAQMNNKKFVENLIDTASYIGNTNELANYLSDQGADYEAIVNCVFEDEELQNSILNYLAE